MAMQASPSPCLICHHAHFAPRGVHVLPFAALSIERLCYTWVHSFSTSFVSFANTPLGRMMGKKPLDVVLSIFYINKVIQLGTFFLFYFYTIDFASPFDSGFSFLSCSPLQWIWLFYGIAIGQGLNHAIYQVGRPSDFSPPSHVSQPYHPDSLWPRKPLDLVRLTSPRRPYLVSPARRSARLVCTMATASASRCRGSPASRSRSCRTRSTLACAAASSV